MTDDELRFLKEFRRLEELEREKGIKFFECIGDPPASEDFVGGVRVLRNNFIENKKDRMRDEDCSRFGTVINSDKVVVPCEIDLSAKPKWDKYQNNHFSMRKRLVEIFLKVVNKQIIRMRAGKRLKAIKKRLQDEQVYNRADCRRMVIEDWKTAQNTRLGGNSDEEENINNVKFQFSFNVKSMQPEIKCPIEYETNIASFMEKIEAEPVCNFDDFVPFEALEQLDFEVEKYL